MQACLQVKRRFMAALLVFIFLLSLIPAVSADTVEAPRGLTLEELQDKFPHGKYWNGGDPDSWTETPCTHHGNCPNGGGCGCNSFMKQSIQCMGFAEQLGYDATGYTPRKNANGWQTYTSSSALNDLKPGDIVRRNGHSMYVIGVDGDNVTIADCNSKNRSCNIRWGHTLTKSDLTYNFEHVRSAPFELVRSYNDLCQRYPSQGTVTVTEDTVLYSSPCTTETQSAAVITAAPGSQWNTTKLYLNPDGEYWYRTTYEGTDCYIPASHGQFTGNGGKISISGVAAPVNTRLGKGFPIGGKITSETLNLSKVGAYIYEGSEHTPFMVSEAETGLQSYSISGSAVDNNLTFGKLPLGNYTYAICAYVTNYHVNDGTLSPEETGILLYQSTFAVTSSVPTHSFRDVSEPDSTVEVYTCDSCGYSYTVSVHVTDYAALCQVYSSLGTVTVIDGATLYSAPSESKKYAAPVTSAEPGSLWQVTELYETPKGDYWYKTLYKGTPCYLYAGSGSFAPDVGNITISGVSAPIHKIYTYSFPIKGQITSDKLPLAKVGAYVYAEGADTPCLTGEVTPTNTRSYELYNSTVDSKLTFGSLAVGNYTYAVKVWVETYHANDNTLTKESTELLLYSSTFAVSKTVPTHSFGEAVITAGTCRETGLATYTCTDCSYSYTVTLFDVGEHQYGDWQTVSAPTYTSQGTQSSICTLCGHAATRDVPALENPVTEWCLTLKEDIGVSFRISDAEQIAVTVGGKAVEAELSDGLLRVNVAAAQMNDPIRIFINGEALDATYTVREYAQTILSGDYDEQTKNLVSHMLLYGGAAQNYFGYNIEAPADSGIDVTPAEPVGSSSMEITGKVDGIRFFGATLLHQSKTAVRLYFAGSIEGLTFRVGDSVLTPRDADGKYYVEMGNICPQDLDKPVTVTVSRDSQSLSVTYSPLDYILRIWNRTSSPESLKKLVQAMYSYHLAAKTYTNE